MIDEDPMAVIVSQVRDAYERLMEAFREGSTDAYFGCFHEDASFIFPGETLLEPRSAYRAAWSRWQREGVRFTDVIADDIRVRVVGETAVARITCGRRSPQASTRPSIASGRASSSLTSVAAGSPSTNTCPPTRRRRGSRTQGAARAR